MLKLVLMLFLCLHSIQPLAALRDPTRPADFTFVPISHDPLTLMSILIAPNRRIAVINEIMVTVGQVIFGNKVLEINTNTVLLDGVNGRITLFLPGPPIKKESRMN